jgi:hypothetical protein
MQRGTREVSLLDRLGPLYFIFKDIANCMSPQVGNSMEKVTKVCVAKGESDAGIKANGDMYAWSSGGGAAAYHATEKKNWK